MSIDAVNIIDSEFDWLYLHNMAVSKKYSANLENTVYSFEFAQSYFRPTEMQDWFPQSWICPLSSFII